MGVSVGECKLLDLEGPVLFFFYRLDWEILPHIYVQIEIEIDPLVEILLNRIGLQI
jgi:hypothetical protein